MTNLDLNHKFIDPEKILFAAGLSSGQTLADFGSGSGFYALAAGKLVGDQGKVLAIDVLESSLQHVAAEARVRGLRNILTVRADLEKEDSLAQLPTGSSDMVLFSNILHQIKNKKVLLSHAYRLLKTGGKLVVIEWNQTPSPIGPAAAERVAEAETGKLAAVASLKPAGELQADPYHYGLVFIK